MFVCLLLNLLLAIITTIIPILATIG
jgi:hypothetical protein